jgi:hypothetical protein
MSIRLLLDDGPADRASIGDTYRGKALPEAVLRLTENSVTCPVTGRPTQQRDNNLVFLVAVA